MSDEKVFLVDFVYGKCKFNYLPKKVEPESRGFEKVIVHNIPCDCNNHRVRFFTGRHLGYIFEAPAEAAFVWQHGEKNAKR